MYKWERSFATVVKIRAMFYKYHYPMLFWSLLGLLLSFIYEMHFFNMKVNECTKTLLTGANPFQTLKIVKK